MAIINGNYSFIDLNAIKGNIIDTLSVYYGEEYRETISSRLDRVLFVPFHSMPYVNEYYNNYIYQFEDEIIDTTLTKLGLESTPELREILRTCSSIKDNKLSEVVYYNNSIADSIAKRIDNRITDDVARAFGVYTGDPVVDREKIVDIYKVYLSAIREVENNHPCQLFDDMNMIEENTINYTRYLLKKAVELGFAVSKKDEQISDDRSLEICDFLDLDCYGALFIDNVSYAGSISYFSSSRERELQKNPKSSLYIIKHRLQYLIQAGATPVHFTKEEILNDEFLYSMDKGQEEKIMQEYYIQMVSSRDLVPDCTAVDAFENYREELSRSFAHNTIINSQMQRVGLTIGKNVHEFFASNRYPKGQEKDQMVAVGINFDPCYDEASFLEIIMHEFNHAISFFNHKNIGKDNVIKTRGIAVSKLKVVDGHVQEEIFDGDLDNLEEYCNQKQCEDLVQLYISMFGIPTIPQSDSDIRSKREKFQSAYNSFDFLADEFYQMFKPELKRAKVDNIRLFHNYDSMYESQGRVRDIMSFVKNRVERLTSPKDSETGYMDYSDVLELARLITEFRTMSRDHNFGLGTDRIDPARLDNLQKYQRMQVQKFISRKDAIMKRLQSSRKKYATKISPSSLVADQSLEK